MNGHRIKAFTILEVSITMLIAAILIGITYTAFTIINKSYSSFNTKNKDMAELELLDELLRKDFDRAELIQKDQNGIIFKKADLTLIKYEFNPAYIIRISGRIDTFKFKTEGFATLFEGQPLNEPGASEEENRLDELDINLLFGNEKIPYHYFKQYSSVNLIQRNPNAIH
jgi:prepilin-type N-terminal cleavage/methylation domain-containing protein